MAASFAHQASTYQPEKPGKVLCLDLGLTTLLATDDGELHGRDWMKTLEILDRRMTGIARHRQRLGLKVSGSARYRTTVQQLRGWLKTEIHRILNRLVARKRPEIIAIEALDSRSPRLSRRMNRLIQNFGQGALTEKLASLEAQYGIVMERREAAYSSKECHHCHYIDSRNRVSQSHFHCKFVDFSNTPTSKRLEPCATDVRSRSRVRVHGAVGRSSPNVCARSARDTPDLVAGLPIHGLPIGIFPIGEPW